MITNEQYFAAKPHSEDQETTCGVLLYSVNAMLSYLGYEIKNCPNTGTQISGSKGGSGDGGFRLPTATTGASLSSHKEAKGIDVYDPGDAIDNAIDDETLERFGLYRENPSSTPNWCHLSTRKPHSGSRTFQP